MKKIPVYTLQTISCKPSKIGHIELLRFEDHLKNLDGVHFPHRHDFYYLLYVRSGKGTHTVDFKTYDFEPGQLYVMSPGQVHEWQIRSAMKGYVLFFNREAFYNDALKIEEQWPYFHSYFHEPLHKIPKKQQPELEDWLERMLQEYHVANLRQPLVMKYLLCALLYKIAGLLPTTAHHGEDDNPVRRYELLMDAHFEKEHEISFYADKLHITPNYLNSLCKKQTGKAAKVLLSDRLMLEIKRLLLHSTLSINQVSDYLHFKTSSYFIRFFRKHEGITPLAFRKQHDKNH